MAIGSGWNLWVWLAGCGCNLWVWLVSVLARRYRRSGNFRVKNISCFKISWR